jgi:hypothetical protein
MIRIGIGNAVRVDCGPWATVPPDGRYGLIWINLEGRWPQRPWPQGLGPSMGDTD